MSRTRNRRRGLVRLLVFGALALGGATVPAAPSNADHIRAMVVTQSDVNGLTVTLRVDYNFSGNPCCGNFDFFTGEAPLPGRHGVVEDGISNGAYTFDIDPAEERQFEGTNNDSFYYRRTKLDGADIVRLEITYTYAAAGVYTVTWSDCCPWSDLVTVVVAGAPKVKQRILTFAESPNLTEAMDAAGFLRCTEPATIVCYDELDVVQFAAANLNDYRAIVVGDNSPATVTNALGLRELLAVKPWLDAGGHGIVQYGQNLGATWDWIPNTGGGDLSSVIAPGQTVEPKLYPGINVTPQGSAAALVAHRSYLNQLRSSGLTPSTLSNWSLSKINHFTEWPDFFDASNVTDGVVATTNTGAVVSLAAPYPANTPTAPPSCVFVSGQPIGEIASTSLPAAQQVLRSSISWAMTCGPGVGINGAS